MCRIQGCARAGPEAGRPGPGRAGPDFVRAGPARTGPVGENFFDRNPKMLKFLIKNEMKFKKYIKFFY